MNLIKNIRKQAFSLTETIIMLTILAIAVASLTPMVTRKIVNNTEAGTTINGVSHGRYEIYSKEIVTYGSTSYEKTTKPMPEKPENIKILVFERLNDLEYKNIAGNSPTMNNKGQKSTLYEQINNAKAHRGPDGNIDYVEFKKKGVAKKYPVGGNIIVESSDVIYVQGVITYGNPDTFEQKSGGITLPNNDNRIIEGVLTKKYKKKSGAPDNNTLWHIEATNDNTDDFEGTVTVIPWQKVISGNNTIVDAPIKKNAAGEYVGTFDPGIGTKSLVLHAVGGGGAGGGLKDVGSAITPKTATDEEIKYMKQTLAKRFKEVATKKGLSEANIPIDTLIKVVNIPELYNKDFLTQFGDDGNRESNTYILINKADGTITVKVDVRNGLTFSHELLDYTNILGSQTQEDDLYSMPIWGDFKALASGADRKKPFYSGAVGCGCKGGNSSAYTVNHTGIDFSCKREEFCPDAPSCESEYDQCEVEKCSGSGKNESCYTAIVSPLVFAKCIWTCDNYYYDRDLIYTEEDSATCPSSAKDCCFRKKAGITGASCINRYVAGPGGQPGGCAIACAKADRPITVFSSCAGDCPGASGDNSSLFGTSGEVTLSTGVKGRSCVVVADDKKGKSEGGDGGSPCAQGQLELGKGVLVGELASTIKNKYGDNVYWQNAFGENFADGFKQVNTKNIINTSWLCESTCRSRNCASPGANGSSSSDCVDPTGIDPNGSGKLYNHIYSWTFPFAINRLSYGEAGEAGEYKTTKIAKTTGPIEVHLGIGGSWKDPKDVNSAWTKGKRGPDGTDTVIKMGERNILTARGGKGGTQDLHTYKYSLCYANAGKCNRNGKEIDCCVNEVGKRSTKEILTTASKMSAFENIKALTGNSLIIGIGIGRGGEGAGSRAQVEELKGIRVFRNVSGYNIEYGDSQIKKEQGVYMYDVKPENIAKFKNYALAPSALNFKGGDGAVIITW